MEKMILSDNTEIEIKEGASIWDITAVANDFTALGTIAEALKKDKNLETVQFKTNDEVTGEYTDMILETPLFRNVDIDNDGKKVVANFSLREKTDIEKRLDAIEAGQTLQDGAIRDLGDVVSTIAEGGEE